MVDTTPAMRQLLGGAARRKNVSNAHSSFRRAGSAAKFNGNTTPAGATEFDRSTALGRGAYCIHLRISCPAPQVVISRHSELFLDAAARSPRKIDPDDISAGRVTHYLVGSNAFSLDQPLGINSEVGSRFLRFVAVLGFSTQRRRRDSAVWTGVGHPPQLRNIDQRVPADSKDSMVHMSCRGPGNEVGRELRSVAGLRSHSVYNRRASWLKIFNGHAYPKGFGRDRSIGSENSTSVAASAPWNGVLRSCYTVGKVMGQP